MEELGREREAWFRRFLELPNGIPDEDTFRRLFERIRPVELLGALLGWLGEGGPSGGREVNIDGKTVRGSGNGSHEAVHLVSAWVGEQNLTLGQLATEEKSNEITVIPQVLDLIDISDRCNEVSDRYSEEDTGAKGGLCPFGEGKPADFV
jgi:hypothetical protein